jgi:hypothetical protein
MLVSSWALSEAMLQARDPLVTTVWVSAAVLFAGARFGAAGGAAAGCLVAAGNAVARATVDIDVVRDGVLLIAAGLIVGSSANALRKAAAVRARALRAEAAAAERERLARSIHDSVLQVLARVRKRGAEIGGEAAELAALAGEQEVALRSLVAPPPPGGAAGGGAAARRAAPGPPPGGHPARGGPRPPRAPRAGRGASGAGGRGAPPPPARPGARAPRGGRGAPRAAGPRPPAAAAAPAPDPERPVDPDVEALSVEDELATRLPDEERPVPEDVNEHVPDEKVPEDEASEG